MDSKNYSAPVVLMETVQNPSTRDFDYEIAELIEDKMAGERSERRRRGY